MENKGGEVRRIHIIYFLSHIGGRADHPHLIRVLHLARNGVYLRDVKRWLGELRGKDLPEAFSWSYKRRYKTGYVWQDLLDDDLITPISDNEYVLKGSQIHPTPFEIFSPDEKRTASNVLLAEKKSPQVHVAEDKQKSLAEEEEQPRIQQDTDSKTDTPTKVSSEISQDSLVFSSGRLSSVTDEYDEDNNKPLEESRKQSIFNEQNLEKLENSSSSSLPSLYHNLNKNGSNKQDLNKIDTPDSSFSTPSSSSSSSQSSFSKLRSNSTRVSTALRNLITCGSVDTNDAALIRMKPNQKTVSNINDPNIIAENKAQICKGDRLGGSARCFRTSWNHHCQQNKYGARKSFDAEETNRTRKKLGEFMNQSQHKAFGAPICSQCGKQFKPDKMHKHMKSCKGMKALATSGEVAEKTQPHRSSTSDHTNYLLTN